MQIGLPGGLKKYFTFPIVDRMRLVSDRVQAPRCTVSKIPLFIECESVRNKQAFSKCWGEISMVLTAIRPTPLTLALLLQALHSRQPLRFESSSKIAGGRGGQK